MVELLVSVFIFTLVATACVGAVLMVLDSNRKIQALKTVMDNLSLTLDTMSRSISTGSTYYCGLYNGDALPLIPPLSPADCSIANGGGESLTFLASDGTHVYYYYDSTNKRIKRCILETVPAGDNCNIASGKNDFVSVTSPDMTITNLKFYVTGSLPNDNLQPKVTIAVQGYAGVKPNVKTTFNIQTTLSQRAVDH